LISPALRGNPDAHLPDSHTDFVFGGAVDGLGVMIVLALLALFTFIIIRARRNVHRSE
jgi:cell division protein FtsW (lipid II flippase)